MLEKKRGKKVRRCLFVALSASHILCFVCDSRVCVSLRCARSILFGAK
jgi:hypothetical protein